MSRIVTVSVPEDLFLIHELIHDCWFELDDINLEASAGVLEIMFTRPAVERGREVGRILFLKRVQMPFVKCILRIYQVEHYEVEDTQHVGQYDFNELRYDPIAHKVVIDTGIPLRFEVKVREFEVAVEETDTVVKERLVLTL